MYTGRKVNATHSNTLNERQKLHSCNWHKLMSHSQCWVVTCYK